MAYEIQTFGMKNVRLVAQGSRPTSYLLLTSIPDHDADLCLGDVEKGRSSPETDSSYQVATRRRADSRAEKESRGKGSKRERESRV